MRNCAKISTYQIANRGLGDFKFDKRRNFLFRRLLTLSFAECKTRYDCPMEEFERNAIYRSRGRCIITSVSISNFFLLVESRVSSSRGTTVAVRLSGRPIDASVSTGTVAKNKVSEESLFRVRRGIRSRLFCRRFKL